MLPFSLLESPMPCAFLIGHAMRLKSCKRRKEHRTGRNNHRMLDEILQFTNVSRPGVANQGLHSFRWNRIDYAIHPTREMLCKVPYKQRNIFGMLTKRRYMDRKNVESVEKVCAKCPLLDAGGKVSIGCGDEAPIRLDGSGASHTNSGKVGI
jgi:hypothetical protein